ncbi:MAG: T9SS type A sorting domain-containing protein [Bacteroidetes bacterium]|nr:T9SS type A sorting domain-containing protein [Bacteroidota bacterium]
MTVNSAVPFIPSNIAGERYNLCNTTANFTYTITPLSSAVSYNWTVPPFASITSGQGTSSIVVNYATQFLVGAMTVNGINYCGNGAPRTVQLYAKPKMESSIVGLSSVCANQQNVVYNISPVIGATSYKWTAPSGATIINGQGTTTTTVNYGANGGNLYVTAKNACTSSAKSILPISISCKMGNNTSDWLSDAHIQFVMDQNQLNITADNDINNATVTIYDITGREFYRVENISFLSNVPNQILINKTLSDGIYLLKVENELYSLNTKLNFH